MADTFFGYKEIPSNTIVEMDNRANATSTGASVGAWHGARMPWIHVMSMSTQCGNYTQLWSGNTTGTGYEPGYKRPDVIVEGVDVKKQGELGTTKKAILKLKAFTDEQLNALSTCYLIPGMSVRIQYGWNLQADGTRSIKPLTEILLDNDAVARMNELTDKYASYEGLQGRVVNYTVNYSKEDYWDITIEIVSAASTLAGVRLKNYSMGCFCEDGSEVSQDSTQNQSAPPEQETTSNLEAGLVELINQATPKPIKPDNVYRITYRGYDKDEKGTEDASGFLGGFAFWGIGDGIGNQTDTFITYKALEELITYSCQNLQKDGKPADFVLDSTGVLLSAPNIKIPTEGVDAKLFCADPRKAYIVGGELVLNWADPNSRIRRKPDTSYVGSKIDASKILINTVFARQLISRLTNEQDSVMDYVRALWSAINTACGNPWEIVVIAKKAEKGKQITLSIADIRPNNNTGQIEYVFKARATASNVRDLKMDLKLTEAMKSQALYVNQNPPPATIDGCNNRFGAFAAAAGVINQGMPVNTTPPPALCKGDTAASKCTDEPKPGSFREKLDSLTDTGTGKGVTDQNVASIVADMVRGLSGKAEKTKNCKDSPIPIELQISIDGIGGFRFGQGVSCDRLPITFRQQLLHQVTAVEHSINPTDWTTTINTVARLRPKQ